MLLVDVGKVDFFRFGKGTSKVLAQFTDRDEEVILSKPFKVKLDKDMIYLVTPCLGANGSSTFEVDPLYSSQKKFQLDYLADRWIEQFKMDKDGETLWNIQSANYIPDIEIAMFHPEG